MADAGDVAMQEVEGKAVAPRSPQSVTLRCLVVGEPAGVFDISNAGLGTSVKELKVKICELWPQHFFKIVTPGKFLLYTTDRQKKTWLRTQHPISKALRRGTASDDIKNQFISDERELDGDLTVGDYFDNILSAPQTTSVIHVLVNVVHPASPIPVSATPGFSSALEHPLPHPRTWTATALLETALKRARIPTSLDDLLKTCIRENKMEMTVSEMEMLASVLENEPTDDGSRVHEVPKLLEVFDFACNKLFVRYEMVQICKLFDIEYDSHGLKSSNMVSYRLALVGTPGVGKSCLLALLAIRLAFKYGHPVVVHKKKIGGQKATTYALYHSHRYKWIDKNAKVYKALFEATSDATTGKQTEWWYLLDGFHTKDVKDFDLEAEFRVVALSGTFEASSEELATLTTCLVPFWKHEDLVNFGLRVLDYDEDKSEQKYFVSGGSLRDFVDEENGRRNIGNAIGMLPTYESAEVNQTERDGLASTSQRDRIRMTTVIDPGNLDEYTTADLWKGIVTSRFAARKLIDRVGVKFFETMMTTSKVLHDSGLEGIAFEGKFHTLMKQKKCLQLKWCEYNNINRRNDTLENNCLLRMQESEETKMLSPGTFGGKVVTQETPDNMRVFSEWANDLNEKDYWIPLSSQFKTIDAVMRYEDPETKSTEIWLLQLTISSLHSHSASFTKEVAAPFLEKDLAVRFVVIVPDKSTRDSFRFKPALVETVVPHHVAYFTIVEE